MESDKVYYTLDKDNLFHEFSYSTIGKFYTTYEHYLKEKGLSSHKSVLINDKPFIEYTVIDKQKWFLNKIKYGM